MFSSNFFKIYCWEYFPDISWDFYRSMRYSEFFCRSMRNLNYFAGVCVKILILTGVCDIPNSFLQEYVKFELPPNQPITVSIGVDVKDIPKVWSDFFKILNQSWVSGLWQGLFNNAQCLLHCQVVWLQVPS